MAQLRCLDISGACSFHRHGPDAGQKIVKFQLAALQGIRTSQVLYDCTYLERDFPRNAGILLGAQAIHALTCGNVSRCHGVAFCLFQTLNHARIYFSIAHVDAETLIALGSTS